MARNNRNMETRRREDTTSLMATVSWAASRRIVWWKSSRLIVQLGLNLDSEMT